MTTSILKLSVATAIRTGAPLIGATLLMMSFIQPGSDGPGALLGRLTFAALIIASTLWATRLHRLAGLPRPWWFVGSFLASLAIGGTTVALHPVPAAMAVGAHLLILSYGLLVGETAWLARRATRAPAPPHRR